MDGFPEENTENTTKGNKKSVEDKSRVLWKKNKHLTSLSDHIDQVYGKSGIPARNEFDEGYEEFKIGMLIHEARKAKGMTQGLLGRKMWND